MSEKNPIFAVIIPVYNGQGYIADCLDSLINQDYPNWIAICVNDGSTDNTPRIISEYARKDSRIHIIDKENGGVSSARNMALDYLHNIEYDWISFLDADDLLCINNLSNLKDIICKYPDADYIRTHCKAYTNRADMIINATYGQPTTVVDKLTPEQYFNSGDVGGFTHSCHLSRELIKRNNIRFPEDMKIMEDQVFSIKYALRSTCVVNCKSSEYQYFTPPPAKFATFDICAKLYRQIS